MLSHNGKLRKACINSNAVKFKKDKQCLVDSGHQENLSVWNYSGVEECLYNAGPAPLGQPGWPWPPHFLAPLQKKNGDIFEPRYVCTSEFQYCITKSTSVLIHKEPMRVIRNPFSEKFSTLCAGGRLLHSPTVHFSDPLHKSWHWSCNVQAIVYICHRYSMAYNQVK